ncbi:unnamed protein product [Bursaphelenchus okinawaensis]|uniref:Exostosin GT47 domain-containing protein n=1 Tax=Bursaphelenchus okinawaensis TaxID=465554 RepID=A0A811LNF6_9BILA|nr:unnamed protein product [Bursaphelenchus okinawaensis]CAG9127267.1 unnamed protein product [Bursaphelenchus okinawaensis]
MRTGTPFLALVLLFLVVYSALIYYNWNIWRIDYDKTENDAKQELIRLAKRVKIQEDKKKRFPERADIFAVQLTNSSSTKDTEPVGLLKYERKCPQFDVFSYPLQPNCSTWVRTLHQGLASSRYHTDQAHDVCVRCAVIDSLDQSRFALSRLEPEAKTILLVNDVVTSLPSNVIVFSQHFLNENGVYLDIPSKCNRSQLPDILYFDPKYILQIHIPNPYRNKPMFNTLIEKCTKNSTYHNIQCVVTDYPDDVLRNSAQFTMINYNTPHKYLKTLYLALKAGSIPIIIADNYRNLPLSDMIDWSRIALRIHPDRLALLFNTLQSIPSHLIKEYQRNGRFVFENHLCDSYGK